MRRSRHLGIVLMVVMLAPGLPGALWSQEAPILETYSLRLGAEDGAGVTAHVTDAFFGHGSARARLLFVGPGTIGDPTATGTLSLRVWRKVPRAQITFALLVDRIEVRAFDDAGDLIDSRQLPGFVFGDSASGNWVRTLDAIPAGAVRIEVAAFGNYE